MQSILDAGIDFVAIGRGGILHFDYPDRVIADPDFEPVALPVSPDYLWARLGRRLCAYASVEGFVEGENCSNNDTTNNTVFGHVCFGMSA